MMLPEGYASVGVELGYTLVRVAAGLFFLPHAAEKLLGWFGGDAKVFGAAWEAQGLRPGVLLVRIVGVTETVAGVCLALGLFTRVAAFALAVMLAVAVFWYLRARTKWLWNHGGREFPAFWLIIVSAFVLGGGGRFSLDALLSTGF